MSDEIKESPEKAIIEVKEKGLKLNDKLIEPMYELIYNVIVEHFQKGKPID